MKAVRSTDGTMIAYDRLGEGPALILVTGATATRTDAAGVAARLAEYFTVFAYDRRGRGERTDTVSYAVELEVEDIGALIAESGGSAFVFGHSSGAILALEAARLLSPTQLTMLAIYEPPLMVKESHPRLPADYVSHLNDLIAAGQRGEAVEYFLTTAMKMPAEAVTQMRNSPMWP